MAPSSSSSTSSPTWVYDVFTSFRGEDVRVTFLSHFLKELDRKLINAFKDNEIERSRSLDPELKQAIKDSRIAVVVFSKNYASSSWCLNELLEIVKCKDECGQMVIPVFYGLDPSHVRKQTGDFGKIFEETCDNKTEEVKFRWREALTNVANILGYHSVTWGNEAKMIEEIANDVLDKLLLTPSKDSEYFVGIEDHIAKMIVLLQLESEEARMVGLWGSSGIGKTTIARALFNRLSRHFQGSVFIDRASVSKSMEIYNRANPDDYNMKLHLQGNLLSEILGKRNIKINHLSVVGERLKHKKVLIFIDDLDDQMVLDTLVGHTQWFGSGSRIIVVTNDKHFLRAHGIGHIYEVCLPSDDLAREMLCQSAFRRKSPPEGFEKLVVEVARHAGSLPLGLNILGSSLRGRDKEYWMDMLPMLQNGIDGKIEKTLRVSYDGLGSEADKAIFRHIACFFNGVGVRYMKLLLADSGLGVNIGLGNLADKSLIDVRGGIVEMHRLLQGMGKNVVRLDEPEKREFLVDSQEICDVLNEGTGTKKILGISLDIDEIDELHVHENAFKGMCNLRFLKILGEEGTLHLPKSFDYFPPKLKLLCWDKYPMRCMPSKFRPENLVQLEMKNSKLEKLWEGVVSLRCLNEMNLEGSHNLKEIPDLSMATNLEYLRLGDCYSLVELPSTIRNLNQLMDLNMSSCKNLVTLPVGINLKSLIFLFLGGCSQLRTFPEISTNISVLYLDETAIEEFPSNLLLENLCELGMKNVKNEKLWQGVQVCSSNLCIFIDRAFLSKSMGIYNRANADDYNMKLHLQGNFLSEILGKRHIKINHLSAVGERLKHQKVLIFIDDLDDQVVLDALVGQTQWFGCGSRIIVVTNDKHFLRAHGIVHIYEVCLPSDDLAREMLCQYAFRKKYSLDGFENLVVEVARHAGSLPLGLNVLGSSLRGRDKEYWMDMLPRLQNGIDGKIEKTLRVSYDGLGSEEDKALFRHIACIFNGVGVRYMKLLLADSGLGVNIGLGNLADKSLIDVRWGIVEMHRLLQEMGKNIVRLDEPEEREFLVDSQDICDVLNEGTGTKKILGISLDIDEIDELHVHENAFKGMRNLRFLNIYSKSFHKMGKQGTLHLPESFDYLLPKLKLLCWHEYPMRCMPSKFRPENLVKLKMVNSKLEKLWEGVVSLTCLNEMNLEGSHNLKEIPDLSMATNLEYLKLVDCYSLVELPSSIRNLNQLMDLDMRSCKNLVTLPVEINLKSLYRLNLKGCSRLRTFPEISTNISVLFLGETAIEEFPSNLLLENLCELRMKNVKNEKLWQGVQPLTPLMAMLSPSLTKLFLSDISSLVELPSSFQNLHNLDDLSIIDCVNLETLPTGMNLQSLDVLDLNGCSRLRTFPDISTNIRVLYLNHTAIEEVPWWIEKFSKLGFLEMKGCNKLEYVNLNISKVKDLSVDFSDCKSLTGASWINDSPRIVLNCVPPRVHINFTNCFNLDQEALLHQQKTDLNCQLRLAGEEVPSYFTHRTTGTSSSLTIPLLHSSLSQPFFRFRACIVFNCDNRYHRVDFHFKGRFWNSFDSFRHPQDFWAGTKMYYNRVGSHLLILDCLIPLSEDSAEMNYNHVDMQIHIDHLTYKIKEWGIRLLEDCSSVENRLGNPNTLPLFFETDLVTETRSKRMRIS